MPVTGRTGEPPATSPPRVYPFVDHLARRSGAHHVINLGCGSAAQLACLDPDIALILLGSSTELDDASASSTRATRIACNLEEPIRIELPREVLDASVIVCSNVIERLNDPRHVLGFLARCAESRAVMLLSTAGCSNRDRGLRPSTLEQLLRLLASTHIPVRFEGLTPTDPGDSAKGTLLALSEGRSAPTIGPAPSDFRVLAIITAYNEADVIQSSIGALLAEGIDVHLIDNWSTDQTLERALSVAHLGRFSYERFPPDGPTPTYGWSRLLDRVDTVAAASSADWCIHHDADERRSTPWPGVGLRDGLHFVQQCGYNVVDHTLLNFWPVDDTFRGGSDPEQHFRYFAFGEFQGNFMQIKTWKNDGNAVRLAAWGGHSAEVKNRRVFPYNFLNKHYPIRSQAHGEQKVFRDRVPRWDPMERANGWHIQYDHVVAGHSFLRRPEDLHHFDAAFARTYLIERLSHDQRPAPAPLASAVASE